MKKSKKWDKAIKISEAFWKWEKEEKNGNWFRSLCQAWMRRRYLKKVLKYQESFGLVVKDSISMELGK